MIHIVPKIDICIATYDRPAGLRRLLETLVSQETEGKFTYAIIISDNDHNRSAEPIVREFAHNGLKIVYDVEPQPNISLNRNRALSHASGDIIAILDDDQYVGRRWLLSLYNTLQAFDADIAFGAAIPVFDGKASWLARKSNAYGIPNFPEGYSDDMIPHTGNCCFRAEVMAGMEVLFDAELGMLMAEDTKFFETLRAQGWKMVWSQQAVCYEYVPPQRAKLRWLLTRYFKIGFSLFRACGEERGCQIVHLYKRMKVSHSLLKILKEIVFFTVFIVLSIIKTNFVANAVTSLKHMAMHVGMIYSIFNAKFPAMSFQKVNHTKFYSETTALLGSARRAIRRVYLAGAGELSGGVRRVFGEMQWRMVHHKKTAKNAKALLANHAISPPTKTLILMYNSMFGLPFPFEELQLPHGCAFTVNRRYWREASAVMFHIPSLRRIPGLRRPPDQRWVAWFMESGVQYPILNNSRFMSQFDLSMSFRRQADIWAPCYLPDFNQLVSTTPKPKSKEQVLAFFFSYLGERSGRNAYVQELMGYIDAHSYGRFLRNRPLPNDSGRSTKLHVLSGYKFNLAFENSIEEDYVTEKFFDPLEAGCVPVYLGAPNIDDYAPGDHCYINAADFSGPKELAEYLLALNEDEEAYNAYHAWRRRPPRAQYRRLCEERRIHPFVRLCQLLQRRSLQPNSEVIV